jgi:heme-degrading monooxygenase HmoA
MFARVTINRIRPGKMDETVSHVQAALLPAAKQQPGFKGFYLLTDRHNNRALTISLWETQDALDATSEGSDYFRNYIQPLPDIVGTENYHVTIQA